MILLKAAPAVETIGADLRREIETLDARGIEPKLAVILAGRDPGSVWYARNKAAVGSKLGVAVTLHELPERVEEERLLALLDRLNVDPDVHGILVELPLPRHLNKARLLNAVNPAKDVDGVTAVNRGRLFGGQEEETLIPATPLACLALLDHYGINLGGRRVTLVGRGETVGRPLAFLLVKRDATVTICHTRTADLTAECRRAEILVAAAGVPALIKREMVSPGTVIVDAGINELADGSLMGDVDFEAVAEIAGAVTPVPGGVGALTTTMIMANLLRAAKRQRPAEQK